MQKEHLLFQNRESEVDKYVDNASCSSIGILK